MTDGVWTADVARDYEASSGHVYAPDVLDPAVDTLVALAGRGRALELAVGTGRVALPLSARGVPVAGIDSSAAMVAELRRRPGSEAVDVTIGDMATATAPGRFTVVYLVYNTVTNLLTQGEQVACFRNAARHLEPGGCFVVEVGVPDLQRLPPGETARPFHVGAHHLGFDTYDLVNQRLVSHHYRIDDDGMTSTFQSPHRYVWPSELDLMAQLAGLDLEHRWADWRGSAFTAESTSHVSVWRAPSR